jgi:putative transposase
MPRPPEKREQAPALRESPARRQAHLELNSSPPINLRNWPHSPAHRFQQAGTYIVTAATYKHVPVFRDAERLTSLTNRILELAERYGWLSQAWAVFPNHYHLICSSQTSNSLRSFLRHLHSITAIEINKLEQTPGRQIWFEFWETRITFPRSYLSRLNYVHQNAVRHGLVRVPAEYPWCSAGWFERTAKRSFYQTVSSFKTDSLNVPDDFEVSSIE